MGFKTFVRNEIPLQIADRLEVNAVLEVGDAQQSVTGCGAPELLSTESASLSATITSKQIQDLPLAYGNPFALIGLTSGAALTGRCDYWSRLILHNIGSYLEPKWLKCSRYRSLHTDP